MGGTEQDRGFPYADLPETSRWKTAVAAFAPEEVCPQLPTPFQLTPESSIASAGSCFA
ncbi:MAG: hypothetical protein ABSH53_10595 [Holophaga sp.]|jgi:hypothetical protein